MSRRTTIYLLAAIPVALAALFLTGLPSDSPVIPVLALIVSVGAYWRLWRGSWGVPSSKSWIEREKDTPDRMRGDGGWD